MMELTSQKFFLAVAALLAFLSVALGAFGAHALRSKLTPDQLSVFEVGVRYQMYHALALIGVALASSIFPSIWMGLAAFSFIGGTLVFSGSLYLLVFTGVRSWGAITPVGGLMFLIGWLCLVIAAIKK
jgi:uncharacterized membrane protein YgdD (TMEM256/DUF423 family)